MKSPTDEIALQGIEFWSTVCDEEADLAIEAVEVRGGGVRGGGGREEKWCFAKSLCSLLNCRHKSKADLRSKSVGSM